MVQSLTIDCLLLVTPVYWDFLLEPRGSTSPFCSSLFRQCAPTLEMLIWEGMVYLKDPIEVDDHEPLSFPRLRTLKIGHILFKTDFILEALLNAPLMTLMIRNPGNPLIVQCTRARENIRTLETLVYEGLISADSFDFLKANQHISSLSFALPNPAYLIEGKLLPLLSSSFTALRSLRLTWNEEITIMSTLVLQMISILKSLEQICLSAGHQFGWRHSWAIDHELMRKYLSLLPELKRIVFSRDSYEGSERGIEFYYEDRILSQPLLEAYPEWEDTHEALWELSHRQMVLDEANLYVSMIPKLEWMFLGQLPVEIRRQQNMDEDVASFQIMSERDDCWTLLRRMFGVKEVI